MTIFRFNKNLKNIVKKVKDDVKNFWVEWTLWAAIYWAHNWDNNIKKYINNQRNVETMSWEDYQKNPHTATADWWTLPEWWLVDMKELRKAYDKEWWAKNKKFDSFVPKSFQEYAQQAWYFVNKVGNWYYITDPAWRIADPKRVDEMVMPLVQRDLDNNKKS